MPFTFSHPAIILPFVRVRSAFISISCLVAGSITPDFEYFLTMKATGRFSHTLPGAFVFCLPVALFSVYIFHAIVKKPLINNLPIYFQNRLNDLHDFDFLENFKQHTTGYLVCLLVGIFSHIAWDSFTHVNAYFVDRFSELSKPLDSVLLPPWPLYRFFQHGSTVIGALVIMYFFHRQPVRTRSNNVNKNYWLSILIIALVTFSIRWAFGFEYFADIVATIISSALLGILIISAIFTLRATNNINPNS